jgi:uncharacterized membrane protein
MLPFYTWCDQTAAGAFVRGNTWAFPLIETVHIMALAVLFGSLFLIDLRLLGAKMRDLPAARIGRELNVYMNWSIAVILVTGVLLFLSEALKAYGNDAFRPKIILLTLALLYHYTVHKRALRAEEPPAWGKLAGALSLLLWFGVGAAGRAIGFV